MNFFETMVGVKTTIILLMVFLTFHGTSNAYESLWCGYLPENTSSFLGGGRYIPSEGEFHVLVLFVQFPDDNYAPTNPLWPKGEPPQYLDTFIDSLPTQMSENGNMTHYFREMSLGKFILTGKAKHVFTPHSREHYLNNNMRIDEINREVLVRVDSLISFAPIDQWIRGTNHNHDPGQDDIVDMIFMLYRNVASEWPQDSVLIVQRQLLGFYGGEVTLGGGTDLYVDSGARRIKMSGLNGSGTTSVVSTNDGLGLPPWRVQIHELSHFFFGGNSWHNGGGFWAMLNDWAFRYNDQRQSCANSFERDLLGWTDPDSIGSGDGRWYNLTLRDFATTGESYKIKVPGSNPDEFFRIEYHRKLSQFDLPEIHDPNAKGLYILHQYGDITADMRLLPADGRWTWQIEGWEYPDYYPQGLPIFMRESVDRIDGYDDSWRIPLPGLNTSQQLIHFYKNHITGEIIEQTVFRGDGNDAFTVTRDNVFTPYSNPNSQNKQKQKTEVAIEIVSETGDYLVFNLFIGTANALLTVPSRPQNFQAENFGGKPRLTWEANEELDLKRYNLYKKVELSDGSKHTFVIFIHKDSTSYVDNDFNIVQRKFSDKVTYWLTAVDLSLKESNETDRYSFRGQSLIQWKQVSDNIQVVPEVYGLSRNFPNPFNPTTTIKYDLPEDSFVRLRIYDLLGRDIRTLINGNEKSGFKKVPWDGMDNNGSPVSSGVYIYHFKATALESDKTFKQTRKMLLIR